MATRQTLDHQSRPGLHAQKKQRDRLIRLAETHPDWALGFADEVWWSRVAQPNLHRWADADHELRLIDKTVAKTDPDPKALAGYGVLLPHPDSALSQLLLWFAAGQPVSDLTIQFLSWCCDQLAAQGKRALLLVWENASRHTSAAVRHWLRAHHQRMKRDGVGVRVVACRLPTKSPWLNPIEPHWVHGKRAVLEPERVLSAAELEARVYAYYHCNPEPQLRISEKVT
ncbi:transposase [Roseiflexus sp.]|uniref:transposase n=1 Tax=Roseiflexus sp. TaxID=2562120 RepID=UPI00398B4C35